MAERRSRDQFEKFIGDSPSYIIQATGLNKCKVMVYVLVVSDPDCQSTVVDMNPTQDMIYLR